MAVKDVQPLLPAEMLQSLVGDTVVVKLKWGMEYIGTLVSFDAFTNVQLQNCEEFVEGKKAGEVGEAVIRCNNILYVRAAHQAKA